VKRFGIGALATGLILLSGILTTGTASATGPLTILSAAAFNEPTAAVGEWSLPSVTGSTNEACLTAVASGSSTSSIPNCGTGADADGSGALELTTNANNEVGAVFNTTSLPTSQGIDVNFDTYQYGRASTAAADGISFALAAANPADPTPPAATGPSGGSLGYSANSAVGSADGLPDAYLGFGLDVFGNFLSTTYEGTGCSSIGYGSTQYPENVTVHGPGNNLVGYCPLSTTGELSIHTETLDDPTATLRPTAVAVEIALNPSSSATVTSSNLAVPADSYAVLVTPLNSGSYTVGGSQTVTGLLPNLAGSSNSYGIPESWIDQSTGLPYQLTFGWTASTGGSNEYHEVNALAAQTVNGQLPVLAMSASDSTAQVALGGSGTTLTFAPSVSSSGAGEGQPVTFTASLPTGFTPNTAGIVAAGWNCSASGGQVISCSYTPSGTVSAGASLPSISVPVSVSTSVSPGSMQLLGRLSSNDASPTTATDIVTVEQVAGAPTGVSATTSGTTATVSWTAPSNNGGAPINGYVVTPYLGGVAQTPITFGSTATSETLSGLAANSSYTFTVAALNAAGTGAVSTASASSTTGSPPITPTNPVVILPVETGGWTAATPGGLGYWALSTTGTLTNHGNAGNYGSESDAKLNAPIVGINSTPTGDGYWEVGSDGGVFAFGDAGYYGSTGAIKLNQPIVAIARTADGKGYWLAAADGGVFSYGDAKFYGSMGGTKLNQPIVGMTATPDGKGYWLVGADGGVFSFGDAKFSGSLGALNLNKHIVGIATSPDGGGYWLVAGDGGVFCFGDASFYGSLGATGAIPINGIIADADAGYRLIAPAGAAYPFGTNPS
jgi:hypothetical protein